MSPRLSHGFGELRAFFVGPWKYIYGPRPELFHLGDDPRELHDLSAERPEERRRIEAALREFLDHHAGPDAADAAYQAGEETRRRLAALGYLSTGSEDPRAVTEELRADGEAPQDRVGDINLQGRLRRELGGGQFRRAERTARRLLASAPENTFYRASLAAALVGLEQVDEAARVVAETEEVPAANIEQFLRIARALFDAGEQQRGLALARRLIGVGATPSSPGTGQSATGQSATGQSATGQSATGQLILGRMLLETGDAAAFEAAVARALELEPEHRGARLELARYLIDDGRLERAEEQLKRLLAAFPVDFGGHLAYARLLRAGGRAEQATGRLERALRLAPGACEAHLELVTVLAELGRREDAAAAFSKMRESCRDKEMRARAAEVSGGAP